MIRTLSLDLETRSSVDLAKCGVYRYCESTDFDILLFGVSINHGPITVYDLACGDTVPEEIIDLDVPQAAPGQNGEQAGNGSTNNLNLGVYVIGFVFLLGLIAALLLLLKKKKNQKKEAED